VYVDPNVPAGSTWILRNIAGRRFGEDLNFAEVTVVSNLPYRNSSGRRVVVALKRGETMTVSLKCLYEKPPALDLDEPGPEQEPDSQMTDAPSSPEAAHSSINPSERSSLGPHSSVDPADYSSDSD
jgi:hypothetical protein